MHVSRQNQRTKVIGVPRAALVGKFLRDDRLNLGDHSIGEQPKLLLVAGNGENETREVSLSDLLVKRPQNSDSGAVLLFCQVLAATRRPREDGQADSDHERRRCPRQHVAGQDRGREWGRSGQDLRPRYSGSSGRGQLIPRWPLRGLHLQLPAFLIAGRLEVIIPSNVSDISTVATPYQPSLL